MTSLLDPPCLIEHEHPHGNVHLMIVSVPGGAGGGGGRGGTLIFSYIRRLGPFLGGSKFRIFNIYLVFRRMIIFGGI